MTSTLGLDARPDRCSSGFATVHHPSFCGCFEMSEWVLFVGAVRAVVRPDGTVHQSDMRPRLRGHIPPKRVGQLYRRAKTEGVLTDTGQREPSNDVEGRNGDKLDRIYRLGRAA